MRLKAQQAIIADGNDIRPGDCFEVANAAEARRLIREGVAMSSDEIAPPEAASPRKPVPAFLTDVSDGVRETLRDAGVETPEDIVTLGMDGLIDLPCIGEKTAEKLIARVTELLEADDTDAHDVTDPDIASGFGHLPPGDGGKGVDD